MASELNVGSLVTTGNVGIGVTPKSWTSSYTALQLDSGGYIAGRQRAQLFLGANNYHDSVDNRWEYIGSGEATRYFQNDGAHVFQTAISGTANAEIEWTDALTIDSAGNVTLPAQPAFNVNLSTSQNAIATTGIATVLFNTERFDQGANFNAGTYTFTAPVTGKYQLSASLRLDNIDTAASYYSIRITTSLKYYQYVFAPQYAADPAYSTYSFSILADMDTSDTAFVQISQDGGTAQTDIHSPDSNFCGYLAC